MIVSLNMVLRSLHIGDRISETLKVHDKIPCSLCLFLLPAEDIHWTSRKGSKRGYTRFCKYSSGDSIKVDNEGDNYRIACSICFDFLDQPPNSTASLSTSNDGTCGRIVVSIDRYM